MAAVALAMALGSAGPALAQANPKIAARDQLSITVVGVQVLKEFSAKYPVGADGAIEFPQLGHIPVAGLTPRDVADLLEKKLKAAEILISPQVTVELEQTANKKVMVNGAVRNQGSVVFAGELTLLEAIVRAGGRLPEASDEVLVVRASVLQPDGDGADNQGSPATFEVNVRDLENGILDKNMVLADGDAIFVRRAQAVTITGYVRNVGAYNVEAGSTVLQALALAGGVSERGSEDRIEITRKIDGKSVVLKKVKKTDVVKPGDIIKVLARRLVE
jgi:polysaccharide export outer membrane protein